MLTIRQPCRVALKRAFQATHHQTTRLGSQHEYRPQKPHQSCDRCTVEARTVRRNSYKTKPHTQLLPHSSPSDPSPSAVPPRSKHVNPHPNHHLPLRTHNLHQRFPQPSLLLPHNLHGHDLAPAHQRRHRMRIRNPVPTPRRPCRPASRVRDQQRGGGEPKRFLGHVRMLSWPRN